MEGRRWRTKVLLLVNMCLSGENKYCRSDAGIFVVSSVIAILCNWVKYLQSKPAHKIKGPSWIWVMEHCEKVTFPMSQKGYKANAIMFITCLGQKCPMQCTHKRTFKNWHSCVFAFKHHFVRKDSSQYSCMSEIVTTYGLSYAMISSYFISQAWSKWITQESHLWLCSI